MNFINDDTSDSSNQGGRQKGSAKDRVISFFYRKRYKLKLQRIYNQGSLSNTIIDHASKLRHVVVNKASIISELDLRGVKYIEVDPKTEKFDFDKYDYYIIRNDRKKGIAPNDVMDKEPVKGALSKMSSLSVRGLERRVGDTKKLVEETQKQLRSVKINLQYPVLHREDLSKMYNAIRENINDLKYEYEILKGETNNRSFAFEEALNIMDKVDKYDTKSIETMETMLKVATLELNKLSLNVDIKKKKDDIEHKSNDKLSIKEEVLDSNLFHKPEGYDESLKEDKSIKEEFATKIVNDNIVVKEDKSLEQNNNDEKEIMATISLPDDSNVQEDDVLVGTDIISDDELELPESMDKSNEDTQSIMKAEEDESTEDLVMIMLPKEDVVNYQKLRGIKLDIVVIRTYEEKIAYELKRQKEIIDKMYQKMGVVTKEISKTYQISGYRRLISSLGNIAVGMLTLPLTNVRILNLTLGASLINQGIKKLQKGLDRKEKIVINYKYDDISSQINKSEHELDMAKYLLNDSVEGLQLLKDQFIKEFKQYEYQIPDYVQTIKNMDKLSQKLENNQKKLTDLEHGLSSQKEKNKVMIKKINDNELK